MPIRGRLIGPGLRLSMGRSVLVAAAAVDTRAVAERLARFEHEHRRFERAQEDVDAIAERLRQARAECWHRKAELRKAVHRLAGGLIGRGHPIRRQFATFGAPALSDLFRLPLADAAAAVRRLVAVVQRDAKLESLTPWATAADEAALTVGDALRRVQEVERELRDARTFRDTLGRHAWHDAYAVLQMSAWAAHFGESPGLHAALFPARRRKRRAVATPARAASSKS